MSAVCTWRFALSRPGIYRAQLLIRSGRENLGEALSVVCRIHWVTGKRRFKG